MTESNTIRHHKKRAFLAAYAEAGNVKKAAELSDVHRSTHYDWLGADAEYAAAFALADEDAGDNLEAEARRRAVEGVPEPVYYQGDVVGTVQKYSDTLLIFLLKGTRPEKYADRVRVDQVVRGRAQELAKRYGITEEEVLAEAESILSEKA